MPTKFEITNEVFNTLATELREKYGFSTQRDLDLAITEIQKKTAQRHARGNFFSLSKMIRGLRAMRNEPIATDTAQGDVEYTKALSTGSTPGSYLVPTVQANEIIGYLATGGIARQSGTRIWDMAGIQKLNVPQALAAPSWLWTAQNSQQTATDPNIGQMSFDLKERRCLVVIPNQLLKVSVPAFDTLLSELIGLAAGEHEDTAFFSSTNVSGAPGCLAQASGITTLLANGNSANGGTLQFTDILAVLAKASAVKAKPPFVWIMSPRTFYQRVLGMVDANSRPITVPTATQGLYPAVQYSLMGYPVFVTPFISETESNGSGTNQSHIIFTNPGYMHIAQDSTIELAISQERYFDSAETGVRAINHEDFGFSPSQGLIFLGGVN